MSSKKLNPFKDFQSDQIQRSSRKIFTAHYACRNATLNLTPVTGTTNGFIFQVINSLIESWGVRLTWFDCNIIIIIDIISSVTVFAGVLFVHQPGANHAPRASVTQVNHSVHTLSTFLRIRADPSMQIF